MREFINIIVLLCCIIIQAQGYAQPGLTSPHIRSWSGHYQLHEKIILETDRNLYMVGEEMNIACYIFEPILQRTLDLSKIAYVEFYTSKNLIIEQIKIKINKGSGAGTVKIPKLINSGRYYMRAYTNYMKNQGCAGFTYTAVNIINPFQESIQENQINFTPSLEKCMLYPEGGHVVYNCSNTIVCKFTSNAGHPVPCMARVIDNNNHILTTFATNSYGLGSFSFTPVPKTTYRLEATAGTSIITKDIEIPDRGLTLKKDYQDQDEVRFRLLRYHDADYPLQVEVYHSNVSVYLSTISLNDSVISIPLSALPKGIIQFRLCNNKNEIFFFFFIYNPPSREMELLLQTNKKEYGNREMLELTIKNDTMDLAEGALSISVFLGEQKNLQDLYKTDSQKCLLSAIYPLLEAGPYPAGEVMKDELFLDQILITIKPHDSVPESLTSADYADLAYFPENKHDLIFGTVTDEKGIPISSSPVIQTWIDTISTMQTTRTNKAGKFCYAVNRHGVNRLILTQGKKPEGTIRLQEEFYPEFFPIANEDLFIILPGRDILKQQMLNLQINDSYFEKKEFGIKESLVPFYIAPDKIFHINDYVPLPTLEEFLFEIVPNIFINHGNDKTIIQMQFPWMDSSIGEDPLFLVDGVPVFDADLIANLKCSDLLSIGVVYNKYFYQYESFDGILDIRSKAGDASVLEISENTHSAYFTGIQLEHGNSGISLPDVKYHEPYFRTQLYWNPSIDLNSDGETTITFMTPDNAGEYIIRYGLKTADGSVVYDYGAFRVR